MDLLRELKISHRSCGHHVKMALNLTMLPLFLSGMLLYAHGWQGGPQIWLVIGISLSHWLMLWGAHRMHTVTLRRSAFGTRMVERSDAWFPYLQIAIHGGVLAALVLVFWFIICDLGMSAGTGQHALLVLMLLLWPFRRGLRFWLQDRESPSGALTSVFLSYLHWILFTIFASLTLTRGMVPAEQYRSSEFPMMGLIIWVPAILIVLVMIVLFLDQVFRKSAVEDSTAPRDRME